MIVNQSIEWARAVHRAVCAGAAALLLVSPGVRAQEEPDRVPDIKQQMWRVLALKVRPLRLTVQVVGEDGKPVEGVDVNVGIGNEPYYRDEYNTYKGKSGPDGKFSVESKGTGYARFAVTKNGYYGSGIPFYMFVNDYDRNAADPEAELLSKKDKPWQPWDPALRIMIKRMIKPIPMIVRDLAFHEETPAEALAVDKDMGWDMFEGQWLPPYGKGKVADLVVRFTKVTSPTKFAATMTVRFSNKDDGLIPINELHGTESRLQFPREAPADGYDMKSYSASILADDDETNPVYEEEPSTFPKAYFIRLRTKLDEKGKVASACYGKITSNLGPGQQEPPIRLRTIFHGEDNGRKIGMDMVYYINPTPNDYSLEFDCKTNMAGNETYISSFHP